MPCVPSGDNLPGPELCSTGFARFEVKLMKKDVVLVSSSRKLPSEPVPGWDVVSEAPSSAVGYGYGVPRVAKIVREQEPVCWIYGIKFSMN